LGEWISQTGLAVVDAKKKKRKNDLKAPKASAINGPCSRVIVVGLTAV
jgi:hypothetical protein